MRDNDGYSFRGFMGDAEFVRKVLIVLGLVALALVFWKLADVLLLAFGAILVALILHACAEILVHYLRVPERWSLSLATLLILLIFLGMSILFGTQIRSQLAGVIERLPAALDDIGKSLGVGAVSDELTEMLDSVPTGGIAARIAGIGGAILGGLTNFVLVVVAGIYFAASPSVYFQGVIKLFPVRHHERVESSLRASGEALKLWLISQLIAMTGVGILSAMVYWYIGLPSPYALGLIAGLADFIPFLGPFLGAAPAVIIAFSMGGETALWTIFAILVVQQIEGNVIQPLVTRRVITTPPALALFAILAGSILFGPLGLVFGFPLAVVAFVLVKKLYVRETLGEPTSVPGEEQAKAAQEAAAREKDGS